MEREIWKKLEKVCSDLTRKLKAPRLWGFLFFVGWVNLNDAFNHWRYHNIRS